MTLSYTHMIIVFFYKTYSINHLACNSHKYPTEALTHGARAGFSLVPWSSFAHPFRPFSTSQGLWICVAFLGLHIQPSKVQHLQRAAHSLHLLPHWCALSATCRKNKQTNISLKKTLPNFNTFTETRVALLKSEKTPVGQYIRFLPVWLPSEALVW